MKRFVWPAQDGPAPALGDSVATLGVFDGVHVGHRRILQAVTAEASSRGIPSVAVTFDRHPHGVLDRPPQPMITSLEHRLRLLEGLGLAACVVLGFERRLADMAADEFARVFLRDMIGARVLIVGQDCRFGRGGEGDVDMLGAMAEELALECRVVEPVRVRGEVVSSTAIRAAIRQADFARVRDLLGRPYALFGRVVRGAGRGRHLGFPTANVDVAHELLPRDGVYATWFLRGAERMASVTSIGAQPTFNSRSESTPQVEVHVLDGDFDFYGDQVEAVFVERLRDQERFPDAEALVGQMARDAEAARAALGGA